jgi:hypothetical protein
VGGRVRRDGGTEEGETDRGRREGVTGQEGRDAGRGKGRRSRKEA